LRVWYEGLIAKYEHRAAAGLDLRFEYTFAKALTDGWELGGSTAAPDSSRTGPLTAALPSVA
jgi:hypothetical protein